MVMNEMASYFKNGTIGKGLEKDVVNSAVHDFQRIEKYMQQKDDKLPKGHVSLDNWNKKENQTVVEKVEVPLAKDNLGLNEGALDFNNLI